MVGLVVCGVLAGCGGPRESSATTVDGIALDRGPVVGEREGGRSPGVRALSARTAKPIAKLRDDLRASMFREKEDEGATFTPYLNGLLPALGEAELAYPGDRVGWVPRDVADTGATPSAVVGLFPAPFTTRFTAKRRFYPVRIQCADVRSAACDATEQSLLEEDVRVTTSNLSDQASRGVVRLVVGPWATIRGSFVQGRLGDALAIEQPGERNGYGVSIDAKGTAIEQGAVFGEAAGAAAPRGPGTGLIFALRDSLGLPVWIVTGTDEAGVTAAASSLTKAALAGRVAAIIPAG